LDVGGLDEGGSRLGRGKGRGAGYGTGERRRLVWLGARRGAAREGGALALSEPPWCLRFGGSIVQWLFW